MYLDLRVLAREWRELLDELDPEAHDLPLTAEEQADLRFECEKYERLCDELGISPVEPDTLEGFGDDYEPSLIREDQFVEYAQQLADDIGAINANIAWPMNCIDWVAAARELRYDYTSVTYDGTDYLIRST